MKKNKSMMEFFKLEDRVLFEAAAAAEIAEAQANDPNADMNQADQQAQDAKNAIKNAPPESLAEAAAAPEVVQPDKVGDIDAQIQALVEGEIGFAGAGSEVFADAVNGLLNDFGADAVSDTIHDAFAETQQDGATDVNITVDAAPELVVINSSVKDVDQIISSLGANQEVLILENGKDAMAQINDYLNASGQEYSAIHVVSHGNAGYITLAGERFDASNFDAAEWAAVGEHLTADGDILFYGCNLAENEAGQDFIAMVADASGADVAASTDITGLNGNWDLEYTLGNVNTTSITVDGYDRNLTSISVNNYSDLKSYIESSTVYDDFEITGNIVFNGMITVKRSVSISSITDQYTLSAGFNGTMFTLGNDGGASINVSFDNLIFDGKGTARVMAIYPNANVTISNAEFSNGASGGGSAISNSGTLDIDGAVFTNNQSTGNGGAIFNAGTLNITDATFNSNKAVGGGGAIYTGVNGGNNNVSSLSLTDVTFNKNHAESGGAIFHAAFGMSFNGQMVFDGNSATSLGGAVVFTVNAEVTEGSDVEYLFNKNTAEDGGAIASHTTLSLTNAEFTDNSATKNGGAIWSTKATINDQPGLTLTDSNLSGNKAAGDGGAIYLSYSVGLNNHATMLMQGDSSITGNTATGNGGGIYGGGYSSITLNGSEVSGNKAYDGGGIYLGYAAFEGGSYFNSGSKLTLTNNATISGNTASHDGGGIYIAAVNGTTHSWTSATISGNYAGTSITDSSKASTTGGNGGGIYTSVALTLGSGITVSGNTARANTAGTTGFGGGVYLSATTLTINGSTIGGTATADANKAYNGGGIYATTGSTFNLTSGTISGNIASKDGGGIYAAASSTMTLTNGTISGNFAGTNTANNAAASTTGGNGGGIWAASALNINGSLAVSGNIARPNAANTTGFGGGIYMTGAVLTINGGTIGGATLAEANQSYKGGGVYLAGNAGLSIGVNGAVVKNNLATMHGGGIFMNAGTAFTTAGRLSVAGNSAVLGGGIYGLGTLNISNADITANKATDGAGIYVSGAQLTLTGSTINSNIATRSGGGVFATANSTFSMTGGAVNGNSAGTPADASGNGVIAGLGGGLYFNNTAFSLNGTVISGNTATSHGGGIYAGNTAAAAAVLAGSLTNVILGGDTVADGNKGANGGGAYIIGKYDVTISGTSRIGSNEATDINGLGGGLAISGGSTLTVTDAIFRNNEAKARGGAIYMVSAVGADTPMALTNVNITGNTAGTDGGGVYIRNGVAATLNNVNVTGNTANRYGGGLGIDASSMDLSATTISGNYAATYGGGIYTVSALTINAGVKIINNESGEYGGGILASGADAIITLNTTIGGSAAEANTAKYGGGVALINTATLNMNNANSNISYNSATHGGGVFILAEKKGNGGGTLNMTAGTITHNTATKSGGAIYGDVGTIANISDVSIDANTAGVNGGAIYSKGNLNLNGVSFADNKADNQGGALYLVDGSAFNAAGTMNFTNNEAKLDGGAIYSQIDLSITAAFTGNKALTGNGGAIYGEQGLTITNSAFTSNKALAGNGGAVYAANDLTVSHSEFRHNEAAVNGGAVYAAGANVTMDNTLIANGSAVGKGGGIYLADTVAAATLTNLTIANNKTGGGIYTDSANVWVLNSILWGNMAGGAANQYVGLDHLKVFNSGIQGWTYADYATRGNVNLHKNNSADNIGTDNLNSLGNYYVCFVNEAAGNYQLNKGSYAINRGSNSYVAVSKDLAGNARIDKNLVDMGAYESSYKGNVVLNASGTDIIYGNTKTLSAGQDGYGSNGFSYTSTNTNALKINGDQATAWKANEKVNVTVKYLGDANWNERSTTVVVNTLVRDITFKAEDGRYTYDGAYHALTWDGNAGGNGFAFDDVLHLFSIEAHRNAGTYNDAMGDAVIMSGGRGQVTDNYNITYTTGTLIIDKLAITVTRDGQDKVYDGNTSAEYKDSISGVLKGDEVTYNKGTASFLDKNVGTNKTVTFSGDSLSGKDLGNYSVSYKDLGADITQATLTVTRDGVDKVYNGNTDAQYTYKLDGVLKGDNVTYTEGTAAFLDKNVGTNKTVTFSGDKLGGRDLGNYSIVYNDLGADITKATLTVTRDGVDKVYNGSTDAQYTWSLDGVKGTDDVTYTEGTAAFLDKNVGTDKTVIFSGDSLKGIDLGNYTIVYKDLGADITKATLTVTRDGVDKVYNGSTDAQYTWSLDGVKGTDDVTYTEGTAAFLDKNVGTDKTVIFSGDSLKGIDLGNYTIVYKDLGADITKATLTITAENGHTSYNGQYHNYSLAGSEGLMGEDKVIDVTVNSFRNAGTYSNVLTDATILDADGANMNTNYNIIFVDGTVVIDKATLVVTRDGQDKTYDGTTDAAYEYQLEGKFDDDVTYTKGTAEFLDKNAGVNKDIVFSGDSLLGNDLANYEVIYNDHGADINKANLTIIIDDKGKTVGEADPAFTGSTNGLMTGDTVDSYNRTDKSETAGKHAIDQYQLHDGNDGRNYNVTVVNGTLTIAAPIDGEARINIYMDAASKNYVINGMDHASLVQSVSVMSANREADTVLDTETSGNASSVSHQTATHAGEKAKTNFKENSQKKAFEEVDQQVVQQRTNNALKTDVFSEKGEKSSIVESQYKMSGGKGNAKVVVPVSEYGGGQNTSFESDNPMHTMPSQITIEATGVNVLNFNSVDFANVTIMEKADNLKDKLDIILEEMMLV